MFEINELIGSILENNELIASILNLYMCTCIIMYMHVCINMKYDVVDRPRDVQAVTKKY